MSSYLPLLYGEANRAIAIYNGNIITQKAFLIDVNNFKNHLEEAQLSKNNYVINLCENYYHFLVVFTASVLLRQINLLPYIRIKKEVNRLVEDYEGCYIIGDIDVKKHCRLKNNHPAFNPQSLKIKSAQIVAVVFTSGSTGKPKANEKSWQQLVENAFRLDKRFKLSANETIRLIVTVPAQHMFGFETSIIFPLVLGLLIDSRRPFYPLDLQDILFSNKKPTVLITTPLQLKAYTSIKNDYHHLNFIISATSDLSENIAAKAESIFNTKVFEIYGCSETGAIATRRTIKHKNFKILTDCIAKTEHNKTLLQVANNPLTTQIPDHVAIIDKHYIHLIKRHNDLINIAGKRGSLMHLNHQLKNLNDVDDGMFFVPEELADSRIRLCALVVTKQSKEKIIAGLKKSIDPVFLPKPLIVVDCLPYSDIGKLPRQKLLNILYAYLAKKHP